MLKTSIRSLLDLLYPIVNRFLPFQLYAYLAVGALNTALNILLFALFYQFILPQPGIYLRGLLINSYTISLIVAFLLTIPTGFWLANHVAFNQSTQTDSLDSRKFGRYFLVVLQGLGSDYLLLKTMIIAFNMQPTVAKIISTVVVLSLNYLLQKFFTFRVPQPD